MQDKMKEKYESRVAWSFIQDGKEVTLAFDIIEAYKVLCSAYKSLEDLAFRYGCNPESLALGDLFDPCHIRAESIASHTLASLGSVATVSSKCVEED